MLNCANGTILLVNVYLGGVVFAKLSIFVFLNIVSDDYICVTLEHVSG